MQFSKKYLAIIGLIVILAATNVALAYLYMTKNVNISGGVLTVGAIEIYDADGVTPLTSYDFPLFTGGVGEMRNEWFFVNNTGNQPVYVFWNFSTSSISWGINEDLGKYEHIEGTWVKYYYWLYDAERLVGWYPKESSNPLDAIYLEVGEGREIMLSFQYNGLPNTAETFTLVMSFYAQDTYT